MAIIQTPGDGFGPLLQALITKQQLDLQKQEIKQRREEFELRQEEFAAQRGEMQNQLQSLLAGAMMGDAFAQQFVGADQNLRGAMDNGLSPEELQDPRLLGATQGLTDARKLFDERVTGEFRQRLATATPMQAPMLRAAAPPQALAQTDVRESLDRLEAQRQFTKTSARLLNSVDDPAHKNALAFMLEYDRVGGSLTDTDKAALFPEVFGAGVDGQTIDRIVRTSILSGMPVGQTRLSYGVRNTIPGLPDDFRFPVNLGTTQTERRQVIGMHAASLRNNAGIIDEIEQAEGGISLPAQVHREMMVSSAMSGGLLGLAAGIGELGANWLTGLTGRQQELVAAQFNWANSYRYMVSGQQTSDREFGIILRTTMANVGDTPATIAQKRDFRNTMLAAAEAVSRGEITPVQSISQLQQAAAGLNLQSADPEIQADYARIQMELVGVLADMAGDALSPGAAASQGPLIPDTRTGDPVQDLSGILELIRGLGGN